MDPRLIVRRAEPLQEYVAAKKRRDDGKTALGDEEILRRGDETKARKRRNQLADPVSYASPLYFITPLTSRYGM
jgi:hypothetical protein